MAAAATRATPSHPTSVIPSRAWGAGTEGSWRKIGLLVTSFLASTPTVHTQ